jgi:hypothetical protein
MLVACFGERQNQFAEQSLTQYYFACEDLRKSGFGGEHTDSNHLLM